MNSLEPKRVDQGSSLDSRHGTLAVAAVCIFLVAIVWLAFGRSMGNGFVNYDDNEYVYKAPAITNGLTFRSIAWAFTRTHAGNWHPLTTISHMLDCSLYGLHPWGHHLTNLLLHAAAAIFLFLALRKLTAFSALINRRYSFWASAFVAALFAIHPLRVESVAWISERKDVLSGVFFALVLCAYASYLRNDRRRFARYCLVVFLFALGLMCKPTLVTLPFVLLLLDYWPLLRCQRSVGSSQWSVARGLVLEKIPLFILSIASCVVTLLVQRDALRPSIFIPFVERVGNAVLAYAIYLGQVVYPAHLAVFYPYRFASSRVPELIAAILLLAALSVTFLLARKRYPFLLVGWLWYIGMLVPMIGLAQAGSQSRADRYTYLPQIGLYLLISWTGVTIASKLRVGRGVVVTSALLILAMFTARSYQETSYWRDSETLWHHALSNTSKNYVAHNNLGAALVGPGQMDEAIAHFKQAIAMEDNYAEAHNNLGNALMERQRNEGIASYPSDVDEAITHMEKALQLQPDFAEAWSNLALARLTKGAVDEAIADYGNALKIDPTLPGANDNLANVLLDQGRVDDAIEHYRAAIANDPNYVDAHYGLSNALFQRGALAEAIDQLRKVVRLRPDYAEAHHNLAVMLARSGQIPEAIAHYEKAIDLNPQYAQAEANLGNALLQAGKTDEAIRHLEKAIQLQPAYPEACNDLGSCFLGKGQIDQAITYYQRAVELKPDYAEAYSNLGNALLRKGNLDTAVEAYKKAIGLKPDFAPMQYNLGNALAQKGKLTDAITCYESALKAQPDYVEVHDRLGVALAKLGKKEKALEELKKALELKANYAEAHYDLGRLLAQLGRRDEAVAQLSEALRLNPNYSDAREELRKLDARPAQ